MEYDEFCGKETPALNFNHCEKPTEGIRYVVACSAVGDSTAQNKVGVEYRVMSEIAAIAAKTNSLDVRSVCRTHRWMQNFRDCCIKASPLSVQRKFE